MHDFPTFVDLLRHRSQDQPDRIAFSFLQEGENETESWSYADLDRKARAIAAHLQDRGLAGERALLLYAPKLDFIAGFLGCLYANVTAVPAYPPRSAQMLQRLTSIIDDAEAAIALSSESLIDTIHQRLGSLELEAKVPILATDLIDESAAEDWRSPVLHPDQLAFLQYTSGSTGDPKGVMVSHGNLIHNSKLINALFQDTPESVGVSWLPPYHDMGLVGGILQPLYVGLKMVLMPPVAFLQRPYRWLQAISRWGGTTSGGPNFAYDLCLKQIKPEQLETLDLSRWTLAFSGAEPVRAATIDAFSQTFAPCGFRREAFFPCYGMAETTLIVTGAQKATPPVIRAYDDQSIANNQAIGTEPSTPPENQRLLVSSGQGHPELDVKIVDPETETILPDGKIGEIWVAGASVTQGYWGKAERTTATFQAHPKHPKNQTPTEHPFLRTGDLGFLDQGELFVTGRLKDLIIIRGRNYYPQDIEASVQESHPALRVGCVAAFSVEQSGEEKLVIVQEVERTWLRKLDVDEVTQAIRQAIVTEHQLQPEAIVLLKTGGIPKTSSGKIQRFACRQSFLDRSLNEVGAWQMEASNPSPSSSADRPVVPLGAGQLTSTSESRQIQSWLTQQIAAQTGLAIAQIQVTEPLSLYGLDSLAAVRLTADLEDWLVETFAPAQTPTLSPTLAYDYPTIAQLADYVSSLLVGEQRRTLPTPDVFEPIASNTADIAVIGLGCRFPGAENPEAYWDLLQSGRSGISRMTDPDWQGDRNTAKPPAAQGGFLPQVDEFDAEFFGISPREAEQMDPQQRLLLEVTWESLEHAGLPASTLAGSQTGVFIGVSSNDYAQLQGSEQPSVYSGTGNAHSIAANRLSYFLDLRGPSLAVDTACSSSLVAIHIASQCLRQGDCQQAIAGGVNIILDAALTQTFTQAGMLSPDGQCKTFDESADGYVRGEGCGVVILKRLADAQRDGDRIWGVIRGSAINQDGRSNGLTAPNGRAQQAVIQQAIARARIAPHQISYVETHGTGTALGDPIEVNSLKHVLTQGRNQAPCWIGSVKTNFGHLEAAAGVAGLIKVLLALKHQQIPPHLNFSNLNPLIQVDPTELKIPTQCQAWPATEGQRFAGVSSFGFGGTNAHVIVASAPSLEQPKDNGNEMDRRPWHLLTLSAKKHEALTALRQAYAQQLHDHSWRALCTSTNAYRSLLTERCAIVAPTDASPETIAAVLAGRATAKESAIAAGIKIFEQSTPSSAVTPLAFLFTGQGSQYVNMGRELYETSPRFRATLERCDHLLKDDLNGRSLLNILYPDDVASTLIHQTAMTQPALFALEYALAQLWMSWGIVPQWVMGHSVGEYVAACIAGVFTLEEGLRLIAARARLMEAVPQTGGMLVVFEAAEQVRSHLAGLDTSLVIAAYNGPENTVVSGNQTAIAQLEHQLHASGCKTKKLSVSQAFHSPLMASIIDEFRTVAQTIQYQSPQIPIVSNVTSDSIGTEIATADYWCDHILAPVKFSQSLDRLQAEGISTFIEIGPKPTLIGMGRRCLRTGELQWFPSLRPGKSDWQQLLESLAHLYLMGMPINWKAVDGTHQDQRISLPYYPWQRQRHWLEQLSYPKVSAVSTNSQSTNQSVPPCYQPTWHPVEIHAAPPKLGQWIFWGSLKAYEAFAEALPTEQTALLVNEDSGIMTAETQDVPIENAWRQLLETLHSQSPVLGIIDARRIDDDESSEMKLDKVGPEAIALTRVLHHSLLALVKAVASLTEVTDWPKVWAIAPASTDSPWTALQSSLGGLSKGIALEHPEIWGGLILLEHHWQQPWASVTQVLQYANKASESTFRLTSDNRYVERLELTHPTHVDSKPQPLCQTQATYLVTGGLGALGLATAEWLIGQDAKHLLLVGRKPPTPEAQRKLQAWRSQGIEVTPLSVDLTQPTSLEVLQTAIKATAHPLKGIIHAAGVLDDHTIFNLTADQFQQVFDVKVQGAWMLHELSLDYPLDFFIAYSSVAAILGSVGQSHYAAANAALDALAHYRQSRGLPGLSINWGPWADAGMATVDATRRSLKSFGFDFLTAQENFQRLRPYLQTAQHPPQVGIFQVDWQQFAAHPGTYRLHPLLQELLPKVEDRPATPFVEQLQALSPEEQSHKILEYLRQTLAQLMQVSATEIAPDAHLMKMGADSLMVMDAIAQIQQDLDLMVYPREIYEHPHLDDLAQYLAREFQRLHGNDPLPQINTTASESVSQDLQQLTGAIAPFKDTQKLPSAVFILSSPRAGSTLLRVMLAGNSHLFSPPELHLLPFATMGDRAQDLKTSHLGEGLQRALMDLRGLTPEASQALIQEWETQNQPIADVYESLQTLAGDRLLVDKSPSYGMRIENLERAHALFENAKFIHLVRHPYAMMDSFAKLRMEKLLGIETRDPYPIAEEIWLQSNRNILNFGQRLGATQYHQLSYEDLVQNPQAALEDICEFLEVPFEAAMLNPYQGDRLTDGVFQQSMSVGDPNFQKHSQVEADLAHRWQQVKLPRPLQPETVTLAHQFAYELLPTAALQSAALQNGQQPAPPAEKAPISVEMREHVLQVRGLDLCLIEWGPKDGTPILCLHGILDQGLVWEPVAMALAEAGYRVIAPDLRGHGKSDHVGPGGGYHLMDFLGDVVTLVEKMIDRPMYLVGHSLGSVVAGIFTRVRSQLVRHLILVEPVLPRNSQNEDLLESMNTFLEYTLTPPKHTVMKDLAMAADRLRKAIPSLSLPFAKRLAERGTKPHGNGLIWRWDAVLRARMSLTLLGGPITRDSYLRLLSELPVPLTAIYGDQSTFNRPEDLDEQVSAIPNAKRVILSGGHNLALDAPAALVGCILESASILTPGRSPDSRATQS